MSGCVWIAFAAVMAVLALAYVVESIRERIEARKYERYWDGRD